MRYILLTMIVICMCALAQGYKPVSPIVAQEVFSLGEDTVIIMDNPKKDTVYTIDAIVMDVDPEKIALGERYYKVDAERVVALDVNGHTISLENLPLKSLVRARLVKRGKQFVIIRVRVLELAKPR